MKKSKQVPPHVREHAVRMVFEHRGNIRPYGQPLSPLLPKTGCVPQTLQAVRFFPFRELTPITAVFSP